MEDKVDKNKDIDKEFLNTFNKTDRIPNFSRICRVCLRQTKDSDYKLDTRIVLLNNSQEIKSLLEESTGVQIGHLDFLPNHVCGVCHKTLTNWYRFRSQTQRSDEIFKKYLIKLSTSLDEIPNADLTIHLQDHELNVVPVENVSQIDHYQISVVQDKPEVVGFVMHCDSCKMTFTNQISLDNHLKHCKNLPKKAYKCGLCSKSFTFQNRLQNHMELSHNRSARQKYHCDVCRRYYNSPTALKIHKIKACIPVELREQCKINRCNLSQAELAAIADKTIRETKIPCTLCKKVFRSRADFVGHYSKHKNEKQCHICEKVFPCPRFLESHVRVHLLLKVYPCPMCYRSFYTIGGFRSHMRTHGEGEWVYGCNVCQKEFSIVREFDSHMVKHLGDEKEDKEINDKFKYDIESGNISEDDDKKPLAIVKDELDTSNDSEIETSFKLEMDPSVADPIDPTHHLQSIKVESLEQTTYQESTKDEQFKNTTNSPFEEDNDEETDDETPSSSNSNHKIRTNQLSEDTQKLLNSCLIKCHVSGCETSLKNLYKVWEHLREKHYQGEKPPFKCTECEESFENQRLLHLHSRKYYSFKCPICGKVKKKMSLLKKHVKLTHCDRPFKCSECDHKFSQQSALKVHMNTHSKKKQFVCQICSKEFFSCNGLYWHSNSHKDIKELQCPICSKQLPSKSGLKRHIELNTCGRKKKKVSVKNVEDVNVNESLNKKDTIVKMEPNSDDEDPSNEPEIESSIQIKMDPDLEIIDFKDDSHHESSNQSENLDIDLRDIDDQEESLDHSQTPGEENVEESDDYLAALSQSNYQFSEKTLTILDKCKVDCHYADCETKCTSLTEIWDHFKKEHFSDKKPYTCCKCLEQFDDKLTLRLHIKNYYSFKCPVCSKIKVNSGELKRHVLIAHSNERPYQCVKCSKTFSRISYLKSHLISHNGKRNFVCHICSKDFFSKAGLYSHVRSHQNLKELQCQTCNKQFLSKYNLKKHLETVCCSKTIK